MVENLKRAAGKVFVPCIVLVNRLNHTLHHKLFTGEGHVLLFLGEEAEATMLNQECIPVCDPLLFL